MSVSRARLRARVPEHLRSFWSFPAVDRIASAPLRSFSGMRYQAYVPDTELI
jgi:hypothetical protein